MRAPVRCGTSGAAHRVRVCVPGIVGWCAPGAVADIVVRTGVGSCPVSLNRVVFSANRVVRASVSANLDARLSALGVPTTAAEFEYSRVVRWPGWGVTR
uniref:Uncharacterized protein n=1 Tax=Streptomyces avermitilis TaxID=33903 RepID=A0A499W779_STRAX|nr:hypothetical protein SAVMC3_89980 [Streptomyces avermitilis]